ncbi:MAG: site-specific integrase [Syntrophales bacterium]
MAKWIKTNFPGVRYREHPARKNGVKKDQYFTIRYKLTGKDREEGLGWASEDWTAAKAYDRLKELKANRKSGEGPQTLAEKRDIEGKRKEADKIAQELAAKENVTFGVFMTETYLPQSKLDNMKLRYLSIDEAEKLLAALAAKSQNLHDIALLSLHCGLRFGEIAVLRWSCVNWEAGTMAVLNAKTGSRTAYLTAPAKAMLESRKSGKPNELIFPKRSGKDGSMAQASKVFADTVKELGLNESITDRKQKVTFYTLRHTTATHLYESTHDLYLTQRSLGHATSTMTAPDTQR